MASTVVGLEITEESVRAVEVTTGRTSALVACGEVPLPPGAAKDSEVLDAEAVAVALRQLWAQARIRSKDVILAIGSRRVLVREFTTSAMRPDLLRASLPYQVQDLLPVPPNQAVLDFYPISQREGEVTGLLVAAVSETVEELIAAVARAKLRVTRVDLAPFGLARALKIVAAPGERSALVFLGDHTTYVVVATDGIPTFVRVIPADLQTAAVARRTPTPHLEPELALTGAAPSRTRTGLRSSMGADPDVSDLVTRVRSTLAFHDGRMDGGPVSSVFLTGAGVAAPALQAALNAALDVPTRVVEIADLVASKVETGDSDFARNLVSTVGVLLGEGS